MTQPQFLVRIPGSTSNLGPGFDMAGLALDLWLEVQALVAPDECATKVAEVQGEAAFIKDASPLLRAFESGARLAGASQLPAFRFGLRSNIPLARGLGSSGAAVAAGLLLGEAWARHAGSSPDDLTQVQLDEGSRLEGHPDNVVASLLGGCTFSVPTERGLRVVQVPLAPELAYVVAWGATPLSTTQARAALPTNVSFSDAVENPRRLMLLLDGLRRGDGDALALAQQETLHVRHRLPLIPGGAEGLAAAREAGAFLATISGAGSGLLAICHKDRSGGVAQAMESCLSAVDSPAQAQVLQPVFGRPKVQIQP